MYHSRWADNRDIPTGRAPRECGEEGGNMRIGISVAVAVWMLAVLNPLYLRMKRGPHRAAAIAVKAACTLSAAGLCLVGCLRGGEAADWWLMAGLLFCTLGDVVLCLHFVGGMAAFLMGHLAYIAAFLRLAPLNPWSIPAFLLLAGGLVCLFLPSVSQMGRDLPAYCVYGGVIAVMLSLAVPLWAGLPDGAWGRGLLSAAGAALFVFSDTLLAWNLFHTSSKAADAVSLTAYYSGQFLLAASVFLFR